MNIPAYQIHNVLMAYSRILTERITQHDKKNLKSKNNHRPTITNSGKQKAILRKVISDIFDKISFQTDNNGSTYKQKSLIEWKSEVASTRKNGFIKEDKFRYIRYDENNQKSVGVLSVKNG